MVLQLLNNIISLHLNVYFLNMIFEIIFNIVHKVKKL